MGKRIESDNNFPDKIKNSIIAIVGPTGSGKTSLAIALSKILDIEVISADSRQIYEYLNIGTAKPSKSEQKQVPHHLIDIIKPDGYYSAGLFAEQAEKKIDSILSNNKIPVVVGGTGLYIKALFDGLFTEEKIDDEKKMQIREELQHKFDIKGIDDLYDELLKIDPISAKKYSDKNPRRLIRALEYYYLTGKPISLSHRENISRMKYNPIYFGIHSERELLYEKINKRAEQMWEMGLVDEVKSILDMGYTENLNSLNTVGYKETIQYLKRKLNEKATIELIKKNTRNYAKRQMTWFRKINIKWLSGETTKIAEKIARFYNDYICTT